MKILRETKHWEFVEDSLHGVTSIQHKSVKELRTLWNTGYEAEQEKELIKILSDQEFILYCNESTKNIEIPLPF